MDLNYFISTKKEIKNNKKLIEDNEFIEIYEIDDDYVEYTIKKKEAYKNYNDFLFLSPTDSKIITNESMAKDFFELSKKECVEGLMFKNLNSNYKPGLRTGAMAKIKETNEDLDLVIVGAEYGLGKRSGYYSSFYVAVLNDENLDLEDEFLEVGKVSSGIKELGDEGASLINISKLLGPLKISENKNIVKFRPKIILQIRYQEIQKSSLYNSKFALRFPRIIDIRVDKELNEISTITDLKKFSNF